MFSVFGCKKTISVLILQTLCGTCSAVATQDEEMGNSTRFRDHGSPRFGLRTMLEALQADSSMGKDDTRRK